jgi:hypothetical protein
VQQNPERPARHRATTASATQGSVTQASATQGRATHASATRASVTQASVLQAGARGTRSSEAGIREPLGGALSVLPYLLVLAGVGAGVFVAFQGGRATARGAGIVGTALLIAGLLRLALPPRLAGSLASRSKVIDVLAFLVLGGGVLGLAIWLP